MRCEIQECGNYQPCRMFIQNILAVQLKIQATIFKAKFRVNPDDIVWRR